MTERLAFWLSHLDVKVMLPPVSAHATADGMESLTGLAFEDYTRMQRKEHKLFESRSSSPPSWAVNVRELSFLLARYMELRAGINHPRIGTPEKRVVFAMRKILADMPRNVATLDRLIAERMQCADPVRRRALEVQIRTLDGKLCVDQRGPALIVGVIYHYFRCGLSSPETSAALKHCISSVGVRQIASRLSRLWALMQSGKDKKPTPEERARARCRANYHLKHRPVQLARQRAARAVETPEEKKARAAYHHEYWLANKARMMAQRREKGRQKEQEKYHGANDAERATRRERWGKYRRENREKINAYKRASYAKKKAEQDALPIA